MLSFCSLFLFLFLSVSLIPTCSRFFCLSLSRSLFLLSERRELQRDQAGLAYWKQMADQRQEGHSFMKRGLNMPGSCRGACPWMMAAWCVCLCVSEHLGEMVNFVGYQSEEWDPKSESVPVSFFFFFSHHLCIPMHWLR